MATPHVAGVAALIAEVMPTLDAGQLWRQLITTAIPLGGPADFGAGLVKAP
jgi:subtilisin family serine protease